MINHKGEIPRSEYLLKINKMDKNELLKETERTIGLSVFSSHPLDYECECHFYHDACYNEWKNRNDSENYNLVWEWASPIPSNSI